LLKGVIDEYETAHVKLEDLLKRSDCKKVLVQTEIGEEEDELNVEIVGLAENIL
jgi:hypothetical protein